MMTTSYQPLCGVQMCHAYFTDQILRELIATPTPATAERLRRAGLVFRARSDGFVLLAAATGPAAPAQAFPLRFALVARDPLFTNYSDLPLTVGPDHTYCLQLPPTPAATQLTVGAADQLPLRPLQFAWPVPPAAAARTAMLRALAGPGPARPVPVPALAPAVLLDLRAGGSGRYELTLDGAAFSFYADDELYAARPWGLLEIGVEVLAAPAPALYSLCFGARATFWQYHLLPGAQPLPAQLSIGNGSGVAFGPAVARAGATASFRATEKTPLAQRFEFAQYQLSTLHLAPGGGAAKPQLITALPNASPAGLRSEKAAQEGAEPVFISDIFVRV